MLVLLALLPHSFLYIYPFTPSSVCPGNLAFLLLIFTFSACFHLSPLCVPNFVLVPFLSPILISFDCPFLFGLLLFSCSASFPLFPLLDIFLCIMLVINLASFMLSLMLFSCLLVFLSFCLLLPSCLPTCLCAHPRCKVSGRCIPKSWVCDIDKDCGPGDDSDEHTSCSESELLFVYLCYVPQLSRILKWISASRLGLGF